MWVGNIYVCVCVCVCGKECVHVSWQYICMCLCVWKEVCYVSWQYVCVCVFVGGMCVHVGCVLHLNA